MDESWPRNTIWLGARWSSHHWVWNDGTDTEFLDWSQGQPSGSGRQEEEPLICMVSDGKLHDSAAGSPPYVFGVMCQEPVESSEDVRLEAREGELLKVDDFP